MSERRVVITGIGVLSPIGLNLDSFWSSLIAGQSGIDTITSLDPSDFYCQIGGEVREFEPTQYFKNPKDARRADRYCQLAMAGAKMAFEDSGFTEGSFDPFRFGCMVGSGIGGLSTLETTQKLFGKRALQSITIYNSHDDSKYSKRSHINGISISRSQYVYRYRLCFCKPQYR